MRYLAMTAPNAADHHHIMEQQIICTCPILEAYGNAKTLLNNNASTIAEKIRIIVLEEAYKTISSQDNMK